MRTLKLTLCYDGGAFSGWQIQPRQRTVQETFEEALKKVTGQQVRVIASGRTDTGVHALGQIISFSLESPLTPDVLLRALNAELPDDIVVLDVAEVPEGFHAMHDVTRKLYRYVIHDSRVPEVFQRRYVWQIRTRLDADAMHSAAQGLVGTHDFCSFESKGAPRQNSVRTIFQMNVVRGKSDQSSLVTIEVEGDGFLYNMVRAIVGTLVEVGRGAKPENWPADVLQAKDRAQAGQTAPPHGLFLVRVDYQNP